MKIEGLDYNTQRERLVLPEYGRVIQEMVDYAVGLPTKAERQRAAEGIIDVMRHSFPQGRNSEGYEQKLWDHLALMSNFRLDIDYPFDVSQALQMAKVKGVKTIALTGKSGGKIKSRNLADVCICVPDDETFRIQELHLPVYHMLCIAAENEFFGE